MYFYTPNHWLKSLFSQLCLLAAWETDPAVLQDGEGSSVSAPGLNVETAETRCVGGLHCVASERACRYMGNTSTKATSLPAHAQICSTLRTGRGSSITDERRLQGADIWVKIHTPLCYSSLTSPPKSPPPG